MPAFRHTSERPAHFVLAPGAAILGITLIYEANIRRLLPLKGDLDTLDDLTVAELDVMQALDFAIICAEAGLDWSAKGDPVVFDQAEGMIEK